MDEKIKGNTELDKRKYAVDNLPGAAIDAADDEQVDKKTVEERTCTLNNNPRNDDE